MVAPFLNLLFIKDTSDYAAQLAKGEPQLILSIESIIDFLYYHFAKIIEEQGKVDALIMICVFVISIMFFKNTFRYLALFFLSPIRNGVVKDIRNSVYEKTLNLPLSYFSDERKGDIMSRITTDVQEVEWSIMSSLEMLIVNPINIIVFLIAMIYMSPELTLFVAVLLPLTAFIIGRIAKSLKRTSSKSKETLGILFSVMEETLSGLRIIKGFNAEERIANKFKEGNQHYAKIMTRMYRKIELASPMSEFMGISVLVVIMYFGGQLVLGASPTLSGEAFVTYIIFFSQLISPAKAFTTAYYNVQKGVASTERIQEILNADITIKEAENPISIKTFEKEIEFRNVSFSYTRNDVEEGYVLKDINLKVKKGQTVGLVGQSGSGKTTLANMIPRFYDSSAGEILIDGIPIKNIKLKDLRNLLGIVSQESILFNETVFNNIAFGFENVSEEQVIRAAKIANAHDFIMEMEQGYQTNIGDMGNKLSGGQRQRLSIARAVLKNPPILILDEATSALDSGSEKLVQDALNKLMQNRTSIVIAHRLSTIQTADEIVVLERGKIIEQGSHSSLLSAAGIYKKLHELQVVI